MWGGQVTDETGQYVVLNSPETIEATKWVVETYTDPKWAKMLPPGVGAWTDPSNNEAFLAGKIAFTQNGGTLYAQGWQDKVPFMKDVVPIKTPAGAKRQLQGLWGPFIYTFKGAKNAAAFRQLTPYLLQERIVKFLIENSPGFIFPAYAKLWNDTVVTSQPTAASFRDIVWDKSGYNNLPYPGPNTAAIAAVENANVLTDMVGGALAGQKVEDVVKDAHDRCVKIYKEFGMKAVKS
jgi:multiple sugar transport system substrate-binding protein